MMIWWKVQRGLPLKQGKKMAFSVQSTPTVPHRRKFYTSKSCLYSLIIFEKKLGIYRYPPPPCFSGNFAEGGVSIALYPDQRTLFDLNTFPWHFPSKNPSFLYPQKKKKFFLGGRGEGSKEFFWIWLRCKFFGQRECLWFSEAYNFQGDILQRNFLWFCWGFLEYIVFCFCFFFWGGGDF